MKFKPEIPAQTLPGDVLERDYAQARNMGGVHLGEECLFQRRFSGVSYLPYGQILRAWLRQEEVKARMCCSTANFDQFYLVAACADGQERRCHVVDQEAGRRCLDHIAGKNPAVEIGYRKPKE